MGTLSLVDECYCYDHEERGHHDDTVEKVKFVNDIRKIKYHKNREGYSNGVPR